MISGAGAMNPVCPREDGHLEWGNGVVSMLFDTAGDSPVRLCNVAGRGMGPIGGRVADDGRTVLERDPRPVPPKLPSIWKGGWAQNKLG